MVFLAISAVDAKFTEAAIQLVCSSCKFSIHAYNTIDLSMYYIYQCFSPDNLFLIPIKVSVHKTIAKNGREGIVSSSRLLPTNLFFATRKVTFLVAIN